VDDRQFTLDLRVESHFVELHAFVQSLSDLRNFLQAVGESADKTRVSWFVTDLSAGSARATAQAFGPPEAADRVCYLPASGLRALKTGGPLPDDFPPDAIVAARSLVQIADRPKIKATITGPRIHQPLTVRTIETANKLLQVVVWEDLGSVEGTLEMLSVHEGYQCNVYDNVSGRRVPCYYGKEQLETFRAAFNHRVVVSGLIRYDRRGEVKSVTAERIVMFPDEPSLPRIDDMAGSIPDLTGSLTTTKYVRRLRDEQ
jgi:hypothetical protein